MPGTDLTAGADMMRFRHLRLILFLFPLLLACSTAHAQFLMDMMDTTKELGKGLFSMYRRFDHIRISGYIQPQFQAASAEGAAGYSGGNFSEFSDNRFMLRRGRLRFDYSTFTEKNDPRLQFVFQFDGTERGVFIRDFWGRFWEDRWRLFHFTTGMFARPFGFEVNLSSSDREAPERGRMSQILMKTERDLGLMASLEPGKSHGKWQYIELDLGVFNGQGLAGPMEFDSYKDLIGQARLKPLPLGKNLKLSGGLQFLAGGLRQNTAEAYRLSKDRIGTFLFYPDSLSSSTGDRSPRTYQGANVQLKWTHGWGNSEIRAEYWRGTQTATQFSSETPGVMALQPDGKPAPYFVRPFDGGFLLFLQNIVDTKHQVGVKLDWYDPNRRVSGNDIGAAGSNLNAADLRYTTLGFGYVFYHSDPLKLTLWYDRVRNESTLLPGLTGDIDDDVLTARLQFRF